MAYQQKTLLNDQKMLKSISKLAGTRTTTSNKFPDEDLRLLLTKLTIDKGQITDL
jgi:hypothetical protein